MRKIRMGMVGGGRGAFIGGVHRMAAALDGQIDLVCGAFSSNPETSKVSGEDLYLQPNRIYADYKTMIQKEKRMSADKRMDFVSIVTPNHVHFEPAKLALENGFHVVCDKPLCLDMKQAKILEKLVEETGLMFALTHNYTGYPMVKQAREMIKNGDIGKIRKVVVEYPQGWLSTKREDEESKQASWRTDPKRSGIVGAMGDIGTHAENLAEYMTGLKIKQLYADMTIFVEGRLLDDDANVLLRFDNGAKGILHCSQISPGEENGLNIRVWGEKGGLEWHQMDPNSLIVKHLDRPKEIIRTGLSFLYPQMSASAVASAHTRVPAGHPEGYLEGFANIYRNFAKQIQAKLAGQEPDPIFDYPSVSDGVRGMNFIYKVVESNKKQKWIDVN
jgi:predicted dehydrogenase